MTKPEFDVLVIDDDDLTAELVQRALGKISGSFRVLAAGDGEEGLDMLRGAHPDKVERPHIILLDLNMPRMNGFEFLEEIRSDPRLCDEVVFVLTTSDDDADRSRAYQDQVAGYMVKSCVGPQFRRVASLLNEYGAAVRLPT